MAEEKTKAAAKKAVATKAAVKPKAEKAAAPAKKTVAKKVEASAKKAPAAKPAAKPVAEKKAPAKKAAAPKKSKKMEYSPEDRYRMVQTAAYFIAERNGFQGCSAEHWSAAEIEISRMLGK